MGYGGFMEKRTVKRRIFLSNACMVVVTLFIFLMINMFVVKVYAESIEEEFRMSVEQVVDKNGLDDLLEDWTVHRDEFILIFGADGILCIIVLVVISQLFTKKSDKSYYGAAGRSGRRNETNSGK